MDCRCLDGVSLCYITPQGRTHHPRFNGTFDALVKIAKFEGIGSWWKGLSPTLLMAVPATVIYYTSYDQLKVLFGFQPEQMNFLAPVVAGSVARTFAVVSVTPLELLRTKIQSRQHYSYYQLYSVFRNSVRNEGILSLWRGLFPTLLRDVPFSIFYWVSYEFLKVKLELSELFLQYPHLVPLVSGGISGAAAAVLTNPLDVVKTYMQVSLGEMPRSHTQRLGHDTAFQVIRTVVSEYGVAGLYAGLAPRIAKIAPACAIMISSYESFKKYFSYQN
jgi:solute carrier family 25 protein 39/40